MEADRIWTDEELIAEANKIEAPKIYWSYDDCLGIDQIALIVEKGLEGLDQVVEEISNQNDSAVWDLKLAAIKEHAAELDLPHDTLIRFKQLADEESDLHVDEGIRDLAKNTRNIQFTANVTPETYFQQWRGIEDQAIADEMSHFCDVLNVSPHHLRPLIREGEKINLKECPEREGNEYVSPKALIEVFSETIYGGQLVFLFTLDGDDLYDDPDGFRKGPLKLHTGTRVMIHCYENGATSMADAPLLKDLVLQGGCYRLVLDAKTRYGVQNCCGFVPEVWKDGTATVVKPEPEETDEPT